MKVIKHEKAIRYSVLALAIIFLAAGIYRQEYAEVLSKAIQICLSCIGIG